MSNGSKRILPVRDGILDPKHKRMWPSLFLYLYLIQRCDWGTGFIERYSHVTAAEDLGVSYDKIRYHYRKLTRLGYLRCGKQIRNTISVQITKWRSLKDGFKATLAGSLTTNQEVEAGSVATSQKPEVGSLPTTQVGSLTTNQKPRLVVSRHEVGSLTTNSIRFLSDSKGTQIQESDPPPISPPKGDEEVWNRALGELELQMTKSTFDTWLRNSRALPSSDGVLHVGLVSEYAVEWVENRLGPIVTRTLAGLGFTGTVRYEVLQTQPRAP